MLSKYHAVLLPVGTVLYLVLEPSARAWLRRPGPYLALVAGALVFSPVILWNASHGWASFAFQSGRAVGLSFQPAGLAAFLGGQALYLMPWMWLFLVVTFWKHRRALWSAEGPPPERFLLCQAVPALGLFLAVSCVRPILPHWSLVGFLGLMPLLGADWARGLEVDPRRLRRRLAMLAAVPVVGVALFAAQARWGLLPAAHDPTVDMYGWDQIAARLRRDLATDRPGTFVFTYHWYHCGQIAFALGDKAPVLCYNGRDAHAFAQWSRPEDWIGHDGILVLFNDSAENAASYAPWFERIEPLDRFELLRAGRPVRTVRLFRCVRQREPFPFDGRGLPIAWRGERAGKFAKMN